MLEITPGGGPRRTPASGPGRGLTDAAALRYRLLGAARGEVCSASIVDVDVVVEQGMLLSYAVFPELRGAAADVRSGRAFDATAVALELVFDDGGTSEPLELVDQAGYDADPAGQHASNALVADQWNLRRIGLDAAVGRRVRGIHLRILSPAGEPLPGLPAPTGWISDVRIQPDHAPRASPLDLVDTRRGTHSAMLASRGNTLPAVAVPHGFNLGIPLTDAGTHSWPYRYHSGSRLELQGLAVSHAPSPWIGDRGVVQIMPTPLGADASADRAVRALGFAHADEIARPHVWSALLEGGLRAELTATDHVVVARIALPDGGGFVIDQLDDRGRLFVDESDEDAPFTGYTDTHHEPATSHVPRMYFAIGVDRPISRVRTGTAPGRETVSASVTVAGAGAVTVRIATSFIGIAQARRALAQETPAGRGFDELVAAARARWEPLLDLVAIDGTVDQRAGIASDLYRMFLYPNDASENAGEPAAPRWVHADATGLPVVPHGDTHTGCRVREGRSFVNNGFWDTYRTVWPAYFLLTPERAAVMLDGFLEHFRASGWMERWSAPGPVDSMVGTSSDIVFADAVAAGIHVSDLETAYDSAVRNAATASPRPEVGRADSTRAPFRGFVSTATPEGLSWTLEGAVNDFGISVLAAHLAADPTHPRHDELAADARYFAARAGAFAHLFDDVTGFFVGRDEDGRFRSRRETFDPALWGGDYTETNAWGMRFSVPHDGHALASLLGGRDGLEAALDAYFATPETGDDAIAGTYGAIIHEMTEARDIRLGMYALSNQPAHHIPFMYAFTDAPHKAQAIVRDSVRRLFLGGEIGQGFPGDEDNGEMAAWHLFASIGLYPLTPGSGELLLTAPSVTRSELRLGGATTVITATGLTHESVYIQSVTVNGRPWTRAGVPIALLREGARIEIALGPTPSRWASRPEDGPFSMSAPGALPRLLMDAAPPRAGIAFDDDSTHGVALLPGESVECTFAAPVVVELYTVTPGDPGPAGWRVDALVDGDWTLLDERGAETFRWDAHTRAFAPRPLPAATAVRFTAKTPIDLRQTEFLHAR
ncbi:GH92 family glycosyl hydrolase [Microbacterium sp. NEAU-LLC]|uniref:GH92 family glycosyl hydrolase n=1 Tax=Microbacterium helvum TaxID=2773713 RepID=A0ABR8NN54_9MICO|nr:GH92 family glycosyl hydrolase [Microbacterium helvum]MBD3942090.1 GH92 family glycosyl hydrolase [Microbacterium helvum]